jgi:ribosomal protein L44E
MKSVEKHASENLKISDPAKGFLALALLEEAMPNTDEFLDALVAFLTNGVDGLDPYIAKHRKHALEQAKEGDKTELADLFRRGRRLNEQEREFLLDAGNSPQGAKKKLGLRIDISKAHFWLTEVDQIKPEAAISELMDLFQLARSNVTRHLKVGRSCLITQRTLSYRRLISENLPDDISSKFRALDLKS